MKLKSILTENVTADDLADMLGKYYRIVTDAARARREGNKQGLHDARVKQEKIENEIEFILQQR